MKEEEKEEEEEEKEEEEEMEEWKRGEGEVKGGRGGALLLE